MSPVRGTLWRVCVILFGVFAAGRATAVEAGARHAIAMHGEPLLPPGFERLPYVSPDATPGGTLRLGVLGSFDGLNPFTVKGLTAAQGIVPFTVETLMRRSADEPFSLYPLLARAVQAPADRSSVTFHLDPAARFADGRPVTASDVLFSFETLRDKGRPNFRSHYGKVAAVETPDAATIRFRFVDGGDRELPLIMGLMPVFARHATDPERFDETGFAPLLGSGPYRVDRVERGQAITFRRNPDWWGADHPSNRGLFNFEAVRFEYWRDANALFEAFKAGLVDLRFETDPIRWLSGYDVPASRNGRVVRETLPDPTPPGFTGFVFNTRRPAFGDVRVREALCLVFDFAWVNRTLYGGLYARDRSFFFGELAAAGRPAGAAERTLLAPYPGSVRRDILDGTWQPPEPDGTGRDRRAANAAIKLLTAAGARRGGRTIDPATGTSFSPEILVGSRDGERLALAYKSFLSRIGIEARVRAVDFVTFERRRRLFDFDIVLANWGGTPSPGNEQLFRWSRAAADQDGTYNYAGVREPAAEAAIAALLAAEDRDALASAARALDRVLLSGFYAVPLFHAPDIWVAYRTGLRRPDRVPLLGPAIETWWWNAVE